MIATKKPVEWLPDDGVTVYVGDVVYAIHDGEPWEVQRFGLKELGGSQVFRWIDLEACTITFVASQAEARLRNERLHLAAYIVSLEAKLQDARARYEALGTED